MRRAELTNRSGLHASDEGACHACGREEAIAPTRRDRPSGAGWTERRRKSRSVIYKGDWKLATALYVALAVIAVAVVQA